MWLSEVAMDIPPWLLVVIAYERRAFLWYPVPVNSQYTRYSVLGLCMLMLDSKNGLRFLYLYSARVKLVLNFTHPALGERIQFLNHI